MKADVAKLKNQLAEQNSKLDRILEKFVQIETLQGKLIYFIVRLVFNLVIYKGNFEK